MEDASAHFSGNVAQKAIIEHGGKILVCRGIGDSVWEFPGGRLHSGEEPVAGLAREIREELGVDISVGRPVCFIRSYHGKSKLWQVFIAYECALPAAATVQASAEEVEEFRWVSREELKGLPMFDDCSTAKDAFLKL